LSATALETALKRVLGDPIIKEAAYYRALVRQASDRGILGNPEPPTGRGPLADRAETVFLTRNRVAHQGIEVDTEEARDVLECARHVLEHISECHGTTSSS
jgi:hypothetical protein